MTYRKLPTKSGTLLTSLVWGCAGLIVCVSVAMLADILMSGVSQIDWAFLTQPPSDSGRSGGIGPILVSTLLILFVCLCAVIPIGLGGAILLAEYLPSASPLGRSFRATLEILSSIPSIVFGLFGNILFCDLLGLKFSILSGGLTLACMVLPIFIRSTEQSLQSISNTYRYGGAALGMNKTEVIFQILAPAALPGVTVGLLIGVGRALAETAALIFTSGYVDRMPSSLLDSGRSLSIHIYDLSMNVTGGDANAYATAFILIVLIVLINCFTVAMKDLWMRQRGDIECL
ncbi:phosphate ABC transporter permease PstA [Pseudomonas sp. B21-054]|uniref:phosphate ABC transporter permease PstA n=1 Tax=Pseudomonas sp. B21-054 TaxID=2895494 RepID=UPI002232BC14|nr:phosphate ABC transporter permease PstA [Pseudomonas sp. B21-054]